MAEISASSEDERSFIEHVSSILHDLSEKDASKDLIKQNEELRCKLEILQKKYINLRKKYKLLKEQSEKENKASKLPLRYFVTTKDPLSPLKKRRDLSYVNLVSIENALQPVFREISHIKHFLDEVSLHPVMNEVNSLNRDQKAALILFLMETENQNECFYRRYNHKLAFANINQLERFYDSYTRLLTNAFEEIKPEGRQIVYRFSDEDLRGFYPTDKRIVWQEFAICLVDLEHVKKFVDEGKIKTIFEIHCYSGKNVSIFSNSQNTNELILTSGTSFKVKSIKVMHTELFKIVLEETEPDSIDLFNIPIDAKGIVDLGKQNISDSDLLRILENDRMPKYCKTLELGFNQITSTGLKTISELIIGMNRLKYLYLGDNFINDDGLSDLCNYLKRDRYRSLVVLGLSKNQITSNGAKDLAQMLIKNQTLFVLGLEENQIDDEGAKYLTSALKENRTLKSLYLTGNKAIGDGIIDSVIEMIHANTTLNKLWLDKCSISPNGRQRLEQSIQGSRPILKLRI